MTRREAGDLLKLMQSMFPAANVDETAADRWLQELAKLDHTVGEQAVETLLRGRFWPSLGQLDDAVAVVRQQAARARRDEERRQADAVVDALPRPLLEEIPAAVAYLDRLHGELGLEPQGSGRCNDCGKDRRLYRYGKFKVCREDAGKRARAKQRLAAETTRVRNGHRDNGRYCGACTSPEACNAARSCAEIARRAEEYYAGETGREENG